MKMMGIIKFSLIKTIKNKLENELCKNLNKAAKIEIVQHTKDLVLKVWIK